MYPVETLYFDEEGVLKSQVAYHGQPMQFTGLLDKNGKEIYEGDIVRFWEEGGEYTSPKSHNIAVQWEAEGFRWSAYSKGSDYGGNLDEFESEDLEVIGNICENPELIK